MGATVEGTVHGTGGGAYSVSLDDGRLVEASLRGRLKQEAGSVVVGDRVSVARSDDAHTIESVHERANALVRRGRGGRAGKVVAANLDRVFVVVALADPAPSTVLIDRILVLVESCGVTPVLVLNKRDLAGTAERAASLEAQYRTIGYEVVATSAVSGEGIDRLRDVMRSGTSALIGPSGVGKSSLLNAIDPALGLRTGELSDKSRTGRHTTVSARLTPLEGGGLVADTPGFSDVALWSVSPEDVGGCFPDFREAAAHCRFRGCTHVHEPDCAVLEAVGRGDIERARYDSYVRLREEAEQAAKR